MAYPYPGKKLLRNNRPTATEFSDYRLHVYFYFHNVSPDMFSGLLHVFVELGNLRGTSNYVLYWIRGVACSDFVCHNSVQVLSTPVL